MPNPNTGRALRDRFHQLRGNSFNQIANVDPGSGEIRSQHGNQIVSQFLASRNVPDTPENRAAAYEYLSGGQLGMLSSASTTEDDIASQSLMESDGGSIPAPAVQSPGTSSAPNAGDAAAAPSPDAPVTPQPVDGTAAPSAGADNGGGGGGWPYVMAPAAVVAARERAQQGGRTGRAAVQLLQRAGVPLVPTPEQAAVEERVLNGEVLDPEVSPETPVDANRRIDPNQTIDGTATGTEVVPVEPESAPIDDPLQVQGTGPAPRQVGQSQTIDLGNGETFTVVQRSKVRPSDTIGYGKDGRPLVMHGSGKISRLTPQEFERQTGLRLPDVVGAKQSGDVAGVKGGAVGNAKPNFPRVRM